MVTISNQICLEQKNVRMKIQKNHWKNVENFHLKNQIMFSKMINVIRII